MQTIKTRDVTAALITALLVCHVTHAQKDATRMPGSSGADVVEASVTQLQRACAFSDDRLFMRRLAYVETNDGLQPDTYRPGYHGGIWKVDKEMFDKTKLIRNYYMLRDVLRLVRRKLGIYWLQVKWEDLRKPLYSALAARLYLKVNSAGKLRYGKIPDGITKQAEFWVRYYRPGKNKEEFVNAAQRLEKGCSKTSGIDLAFVVDDSGSIGRRNFKKVQQFVKDVIDAFTIGATQTRVGLIKYGTRAYVEFYLNEHKTKQGIKRAVDSLRHEAGSTATHKALRLLVDEMFQTRNGARPRHQGHPRVAIVITDGESDQRDATIRAATRAHRADVIMMAVGVGGSVDMRELRAIASTPRCLHLFLLNDYGSISAIKRVLQKRTCEAPIILAPDTNKTIDGQIPPGAHQNCKIRVTKGGITIKVGAWAGSVRYYVSRSTYPSEAVYDKKVEATPGRTGVLRISDSDLAVSQDSVGTGSSGSSDVTTLFCRVVGDNSTESNVTIIINPGDTDHCKSNPCQHGGECVDADNEYFCKCKSGYTGKRCETVVDKCISKPCKNNGQCKNLVNSFECVCKPGYEGKTCSEITDKCKSGPCKNNGLCKSLINDFECICKPGYEGKTCSNTIDYCKSSPCKNKGVCKNALNRFECSCEPGYEGKTCEKKIDRCKSNPCINGACESLTTSFLCRCLPGWTGQNCDTRIDYCRSKPCLKGTCESHSTKFVCLCNAGWRGVRCDKPLSLCTSSPCQHGNCTQLGENQYECCCDHGWTGKNCEIDIDECKSSPCINGRCVDKVNGYQCDCRPGYAGIHCEIDINECESNPCVNGECEDQVNAYKCKCQPGWTGVNCEIDINECESSPCINGDCVNGVNHYKCLCKPGWTGVNCEIDIDECESNPCVHGTCKDKVNGYVCQCSPGWTGKHCQQNINECESNPCVNGDCKDGINRYTCVCHPGFTGVNCEIDIDECASSPCQHGTCRDLINKFNCVCQPGYTGTRCEIDIDECASNPCVHGQCKDLVNGYRCHCDAGYTNTNCDCVIDNCESTPCKNGVCENSIGGYSCVCMQGYMGRQCEIKTETTTKSNTVKQSTRQTTQKITVRSTPKPVIIQTTRKPTTNRIKTTLTTRPTPPTTRASSTTITAARSTTAARRGGYNCGALNPCTRANIAAHRFYHPHTDRRRFVQCDAHGGCFVKQCGPGTMWNQRLLTCVRAAAAGRALQSRYDSPRLSAKRMLVTDYSVERSSAQPRVHDCSAARNPCTASNRRQGRFYFTHMQPDRYVRCELNGDCVEERCADDKNWDGVENRCMTPVALSARAVESTQVQRYDCASNNPCESARNLLSGRRYFTHAQPSSFIECTAIGDCVTLSCPALTTWNEQLDACA